MRTFHYMLLATLVFAGPAAAAFSVERVEPKAYIGEEKPRDGHWTVVLRPILAGVPVDLTTVAYVEGSRVVSGHLEGFRVVETAEGTGPVIAAKDAIAAVDATLAKQLGRPYTIDHIRLVYVFDTRADTEDAEKEENIVNTMSLNWEIGVSGEVLYVHADTGAVWRND